MRVKKGQEARVSTQALCPGGYRNMIAGCG